MVLIPEENRKDLAEIPDDIKSGLDVRPVRWIDEVFEVALTSMPAQLTDDDAKQVAEVPGDEDSVAGDEGVRPH